LLAPIQKRGKEIIVQFKKIDGKIIEKDIEEVLAYIKS